MEPNTLIFFLYKSDGAFYRLIREQGEEEEEIRTLYIPEIDVSLHGKFVGISASGVPYRKFVLYLKYFEEGLFKSIVDSFISSGWRVEFE